MGRPRKQLDIEKDVPKAGSNSALTDDERHALHLRHCREYELALKAKKDKDAEFKNVGKRIKSEDDSVAKVKKTILARSPEGEAALKAEMEETANVLRWSGVSVGEALDLFPVDRTPGIERAHAEGKRAGLAGEPRKPPHDPSVPQYNAWLDGYHEGQTILASAFAKAPAAPVDDAEIIDGSGIGLAKSPPVVGAPANA